MFLSNRRQLTALVGAAALFAIHAAPTAAAPVSCPAGTVPAFESPDVTLTPEPNTSMTIWSSSVAVVAFCENLSNPSDTSIRLPGVSVTAVSLFINSTVPSDLTMSISSDGTGAFVSTPPGVTTIQTTGITSDASGNATFIMRASSVSQSFLGNADGTAKLIGMHFDINDPTPSTGTIVLPDEGFVFAQTPELDSLALFGTGALGLLGYATMRMRTRNRK